VSPEKRPVGCVDHVGPRRAAPGRAVVIPYRERMGERRLISSGSTFEREIGYSRAVVDGDWVHVSGTTGFDYVLMTISDDVVEQARQCWLNIDAALREAGAGVRDVVRVRYLLPDAADFEPCWPVLREWLGETRPAATMQVCGLSDPRMRIEIEVTARKSGSRVAPGLGWPR
jgi:enamine deaminase RidA (YjgF/YER057c/UK114 family)